MMSEGDSDYEDDGKGKTPQVEPQPTPSARESTDSIKGSRAVDGENQTAERVASIPSTHHVVHGENSRSPSIVESSAHSSEASTEQLLREAVSDSLLDDVDSEASLTPAMRAARAAAFAKECMQEAEAAEHFISVTNPVLHESSLRPYVTYDVTSKHGTLPRRYREFAWLHNMLEQMCPGMIVPALPEKQALGRFDQQFIERRRQDLERFLRRVAEHPDLSRSGPFLEFCTTASPLDTGESLPSTGIMTVGRLLSTISTAANSAAAALNSGPRPKGDVWFEDKAAQVESLEACLGKLLKALDAVRDDYKELANAGVQLGTSLKSQSTSEQDQGLRTALDTLADTEARLYSLQQDPDNNFVEPLVVTVREYQGMAQALLRLFGKREKLVNDMWDSKEELVRAQTYLEKRKFEGPTGPDERAQAEREAEQAKEHSEELRKRLSELSSTIRKECARFDKERERDFTVATVEFAKAAVRYQEKVVRVWEVGVAQERRAPSTASPGAGRADEQ